jgi:glutathione S-transferase
MITLYGFKPVLGLPDGSGFVMKAEILLRMAGLGYEKNGTLPPDQAPKGKLPFIEDAGERIADTTFIRAHIERKYGFDFDRGLDATERAEAWAIERMLEDHLYWAGVYMRWAVPENFVKGAARFFDGLPEAVRDQARDAAKARVMGYLNGHGIGRHSAEEVVWLGDRSLEALSALLGKRTWLMGEQPCGTDATMTGMLGMILAPALDTALRRRTLGYPNLASYLDRAIPHFFPEHAWTPVAAKAESPAMAFA